MLYKETSDSILKSYYKVYNTLGHGFLEKVYENALFFELKRLGLFCEKQKPIKVFYESERVGEYFSDIVVNDQIIIEIKAAETLAEEHEAQLLNYLKATEKEIGYLLNFGKTPQFKRKIFTNDRKSIFLRANQS